MKHLPFLQSAVLIACAGFGYAQTQRKLSVSLDSSRPYVEITFDHYGPRSPVFEDEPNMGIWLTLRNNCILPIEVYVRSDENRNSGQLVTHQVVRGRSPVVASRPVRIEKPVGYESGDVVNSRKIEPGGSLSFSVPITHVTRLWWIRVQVTLVPPVVATGQQPRTFVDFDWFGLSPEAKKASDTALYGGEASSKDLPGKP